MKLTNRPLCTDRLVAFIPWPGIICSAAVSIAVIAVNKHLAQRLALCFTLYTAFQFILVAGVCSSDSYLQRARDNDMEIGGRLVVVWAWINVFGSIFLAMCMYYALEYSHTSESHLDLYAFLNLCAYVSHSHDKLHLHVHTIALELAQRATGWAADKIIEEDRQMYNQMWVTIRLHDKTEIDQLEKVAVRGMSSKNCPPGCNVQFDFQAMSTKELKRVHILGIPVCLALYLSLYYIFFAATPANTHAQHCYYVCMQCTVHS